MRRFNVPGAAPGGNFGLTRGERRKLFSMLVGLGLVIAMLVAGWIKSQSADDNPDLPLEESSGLVEKTHVPDIDPKTIDALVGDDDVRTRVVLEREGLEALLTDVRRLTPASMLALEPAMLTDAVLEELTTNPGPHRGEAYMARGEVLQLETRRNEAENEEEHLGLLQLENGGRAWFLTLEIGDLGNFVRVDGLFLKNYRAEAELGGEWIDAPLLIAPRAVRSYPDLGVTEELDNALFAQIQDDVLVFPDGSPPRVSGLPYDAMWNMMDYVDDLEGDEVDWENAPVLDEVLLAQMLDDGTPFRGKPFHLPISRLQGVRVKQAGENPARLDAYTEGWVGNATWQNVVHFKSPHEWRDLLRRDYVHARGFFLKNFAYESAGRGLRIAPLFILEEVEAFLPTEDPGIRHLAWIVAIGSGLMVAGVFLMLRRDRKRSQVMQERLVERKRKRRLAGPAVEPPVTPITPVDTGS